MVITLTLDVLDAAKLRRACLAAWLADDGYEGDPPNDLEQLVADVFDWSIDAGDGPLDCGIEQISVEVDAAT